MNFIFRTLIKLCVLIIFNIFFWLLCGTDNPQSVWVTYAFIHLVYCFFLGCGFIASDAKGQMVLSTGRYVIAGCWAVVELLVGSFLIILAKNGVWMEITWPLVIQSCLGLVFLCVFGFEHLASAATASSLAQNAQQTQFLNAINLKLKATLCNVNFEAVKHELELCIDLVATSPLQSNLAVRLEEQQMWQLATSLLEKVNANVQEAELIALCRTLKSTINMRNEKLKQGI